MLSLLAVLALSMQMLAPYLVWWSRWNIPAHLAAAFCMTGYIIPGLFTDVWDQFSDETVAYFVKINLLGAVTLCLGILLGEFLYKNRLAQAQPQARNSGPAAIVLKLDPDSKRMKSRVVGVVSVCVVGLALAYAIMGFIPMFTDDPYSARQFKGVYQEPYLRVAYLYRFCFSVLQASMPVILAVAWFKRSPYSLLLGAATFIVLFISLSRTPTAIGVLFFLGLLAARHGYIKWYIIVILAIFPLGSVMFYFLFELIGSDAMSGLIGSSLSEYIASGAPDIADQLNWLQGFTQGDYFSYGRTIFGGLVPFNYPWNPSVWTLSYDQVGANVSEIVSGGLRLTTAEWGYANFGWIGVVILPFASGLINGLILARIKRVLPYLTMLQLATLIMVYNTIGQQAVNFFLFSIHNMPAIAAAIFFWKGFAKRDAQGNRASGATAVRA